MFVAVHTHCQVTHLVSANTAGTCSGPRLSLQYEMRIAVVGIALIRVLLYLFKARQSGVDANVAVMLP